jgi:hypothetical protein
MGRAARYGDGVDDATKEMVGLNEAAYRRVNEAIEAGSGASGTDLIAVRCECGSIGCNRLIELPVAAYEAVRASPRRFLLLDGHETPEAETVVERHPTHVVVEKLDDAARIAEETDPR